MARMSRKQIVIDAERDAELGRLAEEWGVSQSEVIRRAIDGLVERAARDERRRDAHRLLMAEFGVAPDLGLTDATGARTWTREDLYGDRGLR
jgi:hypothetical protein